MTDYKVVIKPTTTVAGNNPQLLNIVMKKALRNLRMKRMRNKFIATDKGSEEIVNNRKFKLWPAFDASFATVQSGGALNIEFSYKIFRNGIFVWQQRINPVETVLGYMSKNRNENALLGATIIAKYNLFC